jgi:homoserine dehydrogenase
LGQLEGGTNMVVIEGDAVEQIVLRGPGAGEGPTASAVMGDICDLARGHAPCRSLASPPQHWKRRRTGERRSRRRVLLPAHWQARWTSRARWPRWRRFWVKTGISIDRMRQYGHPGADAPVLIVTHRTARPNLDTALAALPGTGVVAGHPVALRIEDV